MPAASYNNSGSSTSKIINYHDFKEIYGNSYPWTVYLLLDFKIVYIITFAYITLVHTITSAANSEAFTDRNTDRLFNVSSKYINVNVTSINDAVLWNCRRLSNSKEYYVSLYQMLITVMVLIIFGYYLMKLINLITLGYNFGFNCSCFQCASHKFKRGLTILWHIAIRKKLLEVSENQEEYIDYEKVNIPNDIVDIPDTIVQKLSCWKCFFRSTIPFILQFLLITILCLSYFSYDLHPLACIEEPGEELITYESNRVELKFPKSLLKYQKAGGILVFLLSIALGVFLYTFYCINNSLVKELKKFINIKVEKKE